MLPALLIPELKQSDIAGRYAELLPPINSALRNYTISRIYSEFQVPPSRIEPKLKTLARGGTVKRNEAPIWGAVDFELARAKAQLGTDDELQIAAQAAANVRLRIDFNKKHYGKNTHKGDQDFIHLVGFLAQHWIEHTGNRPTVTNTDTLKKSEFLEFVRAVLEAFAARIPQELARVVPTLEGELRRKSISYDALQGAFRSTVVYRFIQDPKFPKN